MKIFDMFESDWLYKEGCNLIGMGYGKTDGKAYCLFESNDLFKYKLKEWGHIRKCIRKKRNVQDRYFDKK